MRNLTPLLTQPGLRMALVGPRASSRRALMALVVSLGLTGAAVAHEAPAAQSSEAVPVAAMPGAAADAHWLDLPQSPFLEAGRGADGRVSATALVRAWRAAGLTPDQGLEVVQGLAPLTPVAMGVRDARLEAKLVQEADDACRRLMQRYPEAAARLQTSHTLASDGSAIDAAWGPVIEAIQGTRADPSRARLQDRVSMAQAQRALVAAAGDTGLRALRVPLGNWSSPAHLQNLADGLTMANADLARATGWSGRVLGLGGRVELTLGTPVGNDDDRNPEGVAFGGRDGRVQVISQWNTLAHEWLHGLDYVLGRSLLGARGTLSDEAGGPDTAWGRAQAELDQAGQQWQVRRTRAAAEQPGGAYWLDRSEAMAYAFSAWVSRAQAPSALNEDTLGRSMREQPWRSPMVEETQAQAPVFQAMFRQLANLNLTAEAPGQGLGQLLDGRRTQQATVVVKQVSFNRTLR